MKEKAPQLESASSSSFEDLSDDSRDVIPMRMNGARLEGAFVDPAYSWPPADGQGRNAIELMASEELLSNVTSKEDSEDDDTVDEFEEMPSPPPSPTKETVTQKTTRVVTVTETKTSSRCGFLKCCKSSEQAVVQTHTQAVDKREDLKAKQQKQAAAEKAAAEKAAAELALKRKQKRREERKERLRKQKQEMEKKKYRHVPEGVLIYRLDTATQVVRLMSSTSSNTPDVLKRMVVVAADATNDKNRRGIALTGDDGTKATLVACDQRTAIAWLEAMQMMLARSLLSRSTFTKSSDDSVAWAAEKLNDEERNHIEEEYLNLALYSNNLIHTGTVRGTSGIYYSVESRREEGEEYDEETLESIAKRRAVIKDSWDFYRMICSLLRDRRKYNEIFRKMQLDPVYPYLNSMTGLNDDSDEKIVIQRDLPEYDHMSRTQICQDLIKRAKLAQPSLVEICKALAGSLGMEEVGVGPIKEITAALRKAEKKYEGDVLKVTDYCRALLVVKDFSTLLALLELARDSFGPLIRRVKLSSLKSDRNALQGGYRDCKINVELKEHVCEIQIHLWPMWIVCGVDGFRHYRHSLEYSTDSFDDPYDALIGLDRKTMAELIVMSEEAVAEMPIDSLEWFHEKYILDYFAETGLFLKHGLFIWAEVTLRQLIKLRCESPDIGPDHSETLYLRKYLEQTLRQQGKKEEADSIVRKLQEAEQVKKTEKMEAGKSLWSSIFVDPIEALDMIMDPNKKEREEEERLKKEVKASKRAWRKIREERFKFLDANSDIYSTEGESTSEY